VKIELPKDWSQVTLKQFVGLHDLNDMEGDETERVFATIALMADQDIDLIRKIRMKDLSRCIKQLKFLQSPIQGKVRKWIPLRWKGYRIAKDVRTMKAGQYIDINYFLSNGKAPHNFADIMAVLMEPTRFGWFIRDKRPTEHEEIKAAAYELPMTIVKPLTDFFLQEYLNSARATLDYSLQMMEQQMKELSKTVSPQDMVGSKL
jgi:hypothetical protein